MQVGLGTRGFLPEVDPLQKLGGAFAAWQEAADNLPKLLVGNQFREVLTKLPPFPVAVLQGPRENERAMQILSYLGHAYVWADINVAQSIPVNLAVAWYEVAKLLGRPPVLSYASYSLNNFRRLDPARPVELGNIVLLQNFLGGIDEEWFVLVHVDIEDKARDALSGSVRAIEAAKRNDAEGLQEALETIKGSLQRVCKTLERMPERCDPYIYYNRVRPYLHGWKNHKAFPSGLVYEGVKEYGGKPQQFRGETGAQSAIMPSLDGLFGITHSQDELYHYLRQMRDYMPPQHRQFVAFCEKESQVRPFVQKCMSQLPLLRDLYNDCVQLIENFRLTHLGYAANYVQRQAEKSASNPHAIGTGGTPFMQYLTKHKEETIKFLL